jgi:hypothetical protein
MFIVSLGLTLALAASLPACGATAPPLFTNGLVPQMSIDIADESMEVLRGYRQIWGQPRPERVDVKVTVSEGDRIYTNVALHLKGSFTFQPVDGKPSMTLNFAKSSPGQLFHGLDKLHLNNSVQDPTYLCEMLARELFVVAGVPAPRVGHARVTLNGHELGAYVVVEGANKRFLKRHFASTAGNLYDGGSGGDITKALEVDSGDHKEDRSDLEGLLAAAREPDAVRRFERLEKALDVDRFLTFAALEVLFQHWDGYCLGPNNFRLFHDAERDKMVFIPHGMDQLFGVGLSPPTSITPHWDGLVARALMSTSGGRSRYLDRFGQIFTNHFQAQALIKRVDQLAARLRPVLAPGFLEGIQYRAAVENLRGRIRRRVEQVQEQIDHPEQPLAFGPGGTVTLSDWRYRTAPQRRANGRRAQDEGRELLEVKAGEPGSSGTWRTTVLLEPGHYEFTGLARVTGIAPEAAGTNSGVILRISGERSLKGLSVPATWTRLSYEFEVQGTMNTELVCEFRGSAGSGAFDAKSLRLRRALR